MRPSRYPAVRGIASNSSSTLQMVGVSKLRSWSSTARGTAGGMDGSFWQGWFTCMGRHGRQGRQDRHFFPHPRSGIVDVCLVVAGGCAAARIAPLIIRGWPIALTFDLPRTGDRVLVRRQFAQAARAAGVKLVRADADLGTEPQFETVVKARARIDHHGRGI